MDAQELKDLQAPIKATYREQPDKALITLRAEGRLGENVSCSVATGRALVEAGLHPATGGTGLQACSGDMLLEALVACAGVTLNAVASSSAASATSEATASSPRRKIRSLRHPFDDQQCRSTTMVVIVK